MYSLLKKKDYVTLSSNPDQLRNLYDIANTFGYATNWEQFIAEDDLADYGVEPDAVPPEMVRDQSIRTQAASFLVDPDYVRKKI